MRLRILKSGSLTLKSHNTPIVMRTGERDVSYADDIMGRIHNDDGDFGAFH